MRELRPLSSLQATSAHRKSGYVDRCIELSEKVMLGDVEHRKFTPENWIKIRQEFSQMQPLSRKTVSPSGLAPTSPRGLGDMVSSVATPIARALGMPCVDKGTGALKPESPCAGRRDKLNAAGEKISDMVGKAKAVMFGSGDSGSGLR